MILTEMRTQIFHTDNRSFEFRGRYVPYTIMISNKPTAGLWTSSATPEAMYDSAWQGWCAENEFPCGKNVFLLAPKKDLKVFRPTDIAEIKMKKFGREFVDFPELMTLELVDYHWYAEQGFDGFHVESEDLLLGETRDDFPVSLAPFRMWDCESTCWFHYEWIESVEKWGTGSAQDGFLGDV